MKTRYALTLLTLMLIGSPTSLYGNDDWIGSIDVNLSYHEMWQISERMLSHQNALIGKLIEVAKTASCDSSVGLDSPTIAIRMLGRLRAEPAIPVLLSKLNCVSISGGFRKADSSPLLGFPAALALARIGTPAVDDVLSTILDADDDQIIGLCVEIMRTVEGEGVAEYRLKAMTNEDLGQEGYSNTETALRILEQGMISPFIE